MVTREDRLFGEMLGRYHAVSGAGSLLHKDYPYVDYLFHLQMASGLDRKDLVNLYLKNRVDADPADPKRPLRMPGVLPGYQDLVRTPFLPAARTGA